MHDQEELSSFPGSESFFKTISAVARHRGPAAQRPGDELQTRTALPQRSGGKGGEPAGYERGALSRVSLVYELHHESPQK